jgi:flagellar basal body rod protein FlgB
VSVGFIGRTSMANQLKSALDVSAARSRGIADRVAQASAQNAQFSIPGQPAAQGAPIDLETEMVGLADEQLRYEATAKLLEKTYSGLREALREK